MRELSLELKNLVNAISKEKQLTLKVLRFYNAAVLAIKPGVSA